MGKKARESFQWFKHSPVICKLATENCDTPHGLRLANFSIECFLLKLFLCLSLKNPRAAAMIMLFFHSFLRYSAIILLSIAYNSQDGIIKT